MRVKRRCFVLVIDGLGVGEMADVKSLRPQDVGANTFGNLVKANPGIKLTNLKRVGFVDYFLNGVERNESGLKVAFGKAKLAHFGADSYMGHQELAGTKPEKPVRQFVRQEKGKLLAAIKRAGFESRFNGRYITVGKWGAVADNIETDYGLNINVVGAIDEVGFGVVEKLGRVVRDQVRVGRVITMGGVGVGQRDFSKRFEVCRRDGFEAWGINVPALGIYNDKYRVVHMGFGVDNLVQVTQLARREGVEVVLIGKTADVMVVKGAKYVPMVDTKGVMERLALEIGKGGNKSKFVFANVQQTDLSGHEQDVVKYSRYLGIVDRFLPRVFEGLGDEDLFILTADHGNDPTIGHTNHTREKTPVMVVSKKGPERDVGERDTLADVGASVAEFLGVSSLTFGESFWREN